MCCVLRKISQHVEIRPMSDTQNTQASANGIQFVGGILLPVFGNWCGSNWSNGKVVTSPVLSQADKDGTVVKINGRDSPVDKSCKVHDNDYSDAYGKPNERQLIAEADYRLLISLGNMDFSTLTTSEKTYTLLATFVFQEKLFNYDIPLALGESAFNAAKIIYNKLTSSNFSIGGASYEDQYGNSVNCQTDAYGNIIVSCSGVKLDGSTYNQKSTFNSNYSLLSEIDTIKTNNETTIQSDTDGNGTFDSVETKTNLGGGFTQDKIDLNNDNKFDKNYVYDNKGTQFDLGNTQQLIAVDNEFHYFFFNHGGINVDAYNDFTQQNSNLLVSAGGFSFNNAQPFHSDLLPYNIGAFYESASAAYDPATSIAARTGRVFAASTLNGVTTYTAQTAAQLAALDTNHDGKLTGAELNTLFIFQDTNENGIVETGELKSLAAAGITTIRNTDYGLYTAGSARLGGAELSEPAAYAAFVPTMTMNTSAPTMTQIADTSTTAYDNYAALRNSDNTYVYLYNGFSYINWAPNQVKINQHTRSALIGTDGNDNFDSSYYASYNYIFNNSLLTNFYGGPGDDVVGGSNGNDNVWGGAGSDQLDGREGIAFYPIAARGLNQVSVMLNH